MSTKTYTLVSPDGRRRFETTSATVANDYQFGHGWSLVDPSKRTASSATVTSTTDAGSTSK